MAVFCHKRFFLSTFAHSRHSTNMVIMKRRWSFLDVEVLERSFCGYRVLFRESLASASWVQTCFRFFISLIRLFIIAVSNQEDTHSHGFSFHFPPFKLLNKWIQLFSCDYFIPRSPYCSQAPSQYLPMCFYNWNKVSNFSRPSEVHPGGDWESLLFTGNKVWW